MDANSTKEVNMKQEFPKEGPRITRMGADDHNHRPEAMIHSELSQNLAQMLGYLAITGLELALLLNFKFSRLHWKRIVRSSNRVQ